MRVSDRATARNYLKHLHKSQSQYAATNERIASGKRFTKLSDDVSAGSRVLRLRMDRYKAEKQLENAQEANAKLKVTEDNMVAMNWILTMVHENKVVRALNDPTGDDGRAVYAAEIRSMMAEFLQYANASYGKMFNIGGSNAIAGPFTTGYDGKLLYNGVSVDSISRDEATGVLYTEEALIDKSLGFSSYKYEDNSAPGTFIYKRIAAPGDFFLADGSPVITPPDLSEYSLVMEKKPVPMDKDIYYDVGLGITMAGDEVNDTTAFKVSYSGLEVLGFGTDFFGMSNNLYNVMFEIQKYIDVSDKGEGFDRESVEKWNTKLRSLMDTYRINLTDLGVKTRFLDSMEERLAITVDNHTSRIQDLMGVDDAEEATHQMMNDYVLKAVLQLGGRVLPLSLMDFVK